MHADRLNEIKKEYHGTLKGYLIGFFSCLLLTITSFSLVLTKAFSGKTLIYAVVALAVVQAIFQLLFFLHLGKEEKPRWESLVFYFMLLVLLIVVGGTLWIMHDLDQRVMLDMMGMPHD